MFLIKYHKQMLKLHQVLELMLGRVVTLVQNMVRDLIKLLLMEQVN
jgi:hypothetical protein